MTLKDMLKGFRTKTDVEIRVDNYFACKIDTTSNYAGVIKDDLLNLEIEDYMATGCGEMIISVKGKI